MSITTALWYKLVCESIRTISTIPPAELHSFCLLNPPDVNQIQMKQTSTCLNLGQERSQVDKDIHAGKNANMKLHV